MRGSTSILRGVLTGAFDVNYVADLFVEGSRILQNVPCLNVSLNDDASALVQSSGSLRIVYQDTFAQSIAPAAIGDVLAPYGTQLTLSAVVSTGAGFSERILLGTYMISETPTILTTKFLFTGAGAVLSKGDVVDISFKDLMYRTQRNRFDTPGSPPSLASVWAEIQRLTQLPVTRTVADAAIPNSITYQEDRLQAVYDLASSLDATAYMTPDGTVSMRPNVWPATADVISGGDGGTLIGAPRAMKNDTVYNKIVVKDQQGNVLASDQLASGPLRAANIDGSISPYGTVPYYYSNPLVTTAAQAQAYIAKNLPRVSSLRAQQVVVTEVFNPLRDLGDVVTVQRKASGVVFESFTGRVTQISRTSAKTQQTTLAVNQ